MSATVALIVALSVTALVGGIGWGVALAPADTTEEVVEAVAENTTAALAPVLAEQATLREALDDGRLDRHCSAKVGDEVNARAVGCMWVECTQATTAAGRSGSEECGKVRDLYRAMVICEAQVGENARAACFAELRP